MTNTLKKHMQVACSQAIVKRTLDLQVNNRLQNKKIKYLSLNQ